MSYTKTWQENYSDPLVTSSADNAAKNFIWAIKGFLKGDAGVTNPPASGLWTCFYSCDGSVAGTANDTVDRWTTSFDASKIVNALPGNAHSWFILKSPNNLGGVSGNGPYYITIDCCNSFAYYIDIIMSKTAPSGGSTTNRPTAIGEMVIRSNLQFTDGYSASQWRFNGILSTDGIFWIFSSKDNGSIQAGISGKVLGEAASTDTCNFFMVANATSPFTKSNLQSSGFNALDADGSSAQIFRPCSFFDGSETVSDILVFRRSDQKLIGLPMYMYNRASGHRDLRGRIVDVTWGPNRVDTGTVTPNNDATEAVLINDVWLPCSSVPIL